jgi:hypothetical protein
VIILSNFLACKCFGILKLILQVNPAISVQPR